MDIIKAFGSLMENRVIKRFCVQTGLPIKKPDCLNILSRYFNFLIITEKIKNISMFQRRLFVNHVAGYIYDSS